VEGTYTIGTDVDDQQMCVLWHKNWIVSISLSGALNYLDPSNIGTITRTIHGHMGNSNGSIATDTANKVFYTADDNGKICAWQNGLATWFTGKGHGKGIRDLSVNCDGTAVASVGLDDTLRFNETKSNELSTNGIGLGGAPTCVACGKKSADLAVVGIAQNKITVVSGGSATNTAVNYKPLCVDISPCDTKVIVGGDDKQVHLYSLSGGELKEEHVVKTHMHHVFSVRFSPCGTRYSSSSGDKTVLVHDATSHAQLNSSSWEFHKMMVNDHAWSPDGSRIASISNDLNCFIWTDTEKFSTKKLKLAGIHSVSGSSVGWLDNNTLITKGGDGIIKTFTV